MINNINTKKKIFLSHWPGKLLNMSAKDTIRLVWNWFANEANACAIEVAVSPISFPSPPHQWSLLFLQVTKNLHLLFILQSKLYSQSILLIHSYSLTERPGFLRIFTVFEIYLTRKVFQPVISNYFHFELIPVKNSAAKYL